MHANQALRRNNLADKFRRAFKYALVAAGVYVAILLVTVITGVSDGVRNVLAAPAQAITGWVADTLVPERTFNPVELHEFYLTAVGADEPIGHSYGVYHATGFQYIEGGWQQDENVILEDAGYLGQMEVLSSGIRFDELDGVLYIALPPAEHFATTLAIEPVIKNPAEGLASLGQAFGEKTDTTAQRRELKQLVTAAVTTDERLYFLAECSAMNNLKATLLPAFAEASGLAMPQVVVLNSAGTPLDDEDCAAYLASESSSVSLDGQQLGIMLDGVSRLDDVDLGTIELSPLHR